jgi:alanyl-tRNA synthetase
MFYITDKKACGPSCDPSCSCGKYVEIWNDVFMEYFKDASGKYQKADRRNVDTGMGVERVVAVLNGYEDNYQVDTLLPIIKKFEVMGDRVTSDKDYGAEGSKRIIADHLRATVMIMGDQKGIAPSNVDQGYVVRKLIRRAVRHGKKLGIENNFCAEVAEEVIKIFADVYPEVEKNKDFVLREMDNEESKFRKTLESGIKQFEQVTGSRLQVTGKEAFDLFQSYGFPLEMTVELAKERGIEVDADGFNEEMKKHQDLSRAGAEQKFKGGLADASEETKKLHTATHLLHAALRKVLGTHVEQQGSNITAERLRFDFSHPEKMTEEQVKQVEDLVNDAINNDYLVTMEEMTVEEAKKLGAIGLFGDRYGAKVKVYTVGDSKAPFSREICGGPHVEHTGELKGFQIKKEEASSAGVRRIKAVLE